VILDARLGLYSINYGLSIDTRFVFRWFIELAQDKLWIKH
jgi:hypothetical protein